MTNLAALVLGFSLLSVLLLWPLSAPAQSDRPNTDALARCVQLERDAERLRCYDTIAGRALERPAARDEERESLETAESAPEAGPFPNSSESDEPEEESITRIVRIDERPRGERTFELANGERWTEQTRERTRFRVGDAVTVRRTALGGALLVREAGGATRVRPLD